MRIIFLDIDGVLNSWATLYKITTEKLQLLNNLIEQTGAKIVISSSWRIGSENVKDFIDKNFSKSTFRLDNFKDATNRECIENIFYNDNIIGLTDTFGPSRGDEIKRWLDNHEDIKSYVIIDDSIDMLDEQLEYLVQTDTYYGLTDREVHLACLILKNKCIPNKVRLNNELYFRYRKKLEGLI